MPLFLGPLISALVSSLGASATAVAASATTAAGSIGSAAAGLGSAAAGAAGAVSTGITTAAASGVSAVASGATSVISGIGSSVNAVAAVANVAEGAIASGIATAEGAIAGAIGTGESVILGKAATLIEAVPQLQTAIEVFDAASLANEATNAVAGLETLLAENTITGMLGEGLLGELAVKAAPVLGELSASKYALDSAVFTFYQVLAEGVTAKNFGAFAGACVSIQAAMAKATEQAAAKA